MPRKTKGEPTSPDLAAEIHRLTNVAALLLVKGESQGEKIRTLASVGYTNVEIGTLLGLTPNAVAVALHRLRGK